MSEPKSDQSPLEREQAMQGPPPALSLEEKLQGAAADLQLYQSLAAKPGLSPMAARWVNDQARSARSALRLYQKALLYQDNQEDEAQAQEDDPYVLSLLGLQQSPQGQPTASTGRKASSSTKPGTFGSTT